MKGINGIIGQLNLIDLLQKTDTSESCNTGFGLSADVEKTNLRDYLKRDIKISTLARLVVPKRKSIKDVSFFEFLKGKKAKRSVMYRFLEMQLGAYLKKKFTANDDSILEMTNDTVSFVELTHSDLTHAQRYLRKAKRVVCLGDSLDTDIDFEGRVLLSDQKVKPWFRRYSDLSCYYECLNMTHFAPIYAYGYILRNVKERLESLAEDECTDDCLLAKLQESVVEELKAYSSCNYVYALDELRRTHLDEALSKSGYQVIYISNEQEKSIKETYSCSVISDIRFLPSTCLLYDVKVNYEDLRRMSSYSLFGYMSILYDEYKTDEQVRRYINTEGTSARVFETKKNIPNKIIEQMKNSGFNNYFGYVEFDESCDIDLLKQIETEFKALKSLCFDPDKHDNVQIRFRLLGRHHATGLYFPTLKCLCVDVRFPSSCGHEYMHMLDHEMGDRSRGYAFSFVITEYKRAFCDWLDKLPKDDILRTKLKGGSKFNMDYYFTPTEIFARCGEIYLTRHMGVDNSLLKPEKNYAYPEDEKLDKAIVKYYDKFFAEIRNTEADTKEQKVAASC